MSHSLFDLRLLDLVAEAVVQLKTGWQAPVSVPESAGSTSREHDPGGDLRIDVFSVLNCESMDDFNRYIPGVAPVFQTPVLGVWRDGKLAEAAQGFQARKQIGQLLGFSGAEVVQWVDCHGWSLVTRHGVIQNTLSRNV